MLYPQVGSRKTKLATQFLSMHYLAIHDIRPAKQLRRMRHITRRQRKTHARTGDTLAIHNKASHCFGGESISGTKLLQQPEIPTTTLAKAKIVTHHDVSYLQPAHQNICHKLFGTQAGEGMIKAANHRLTDATICEQLKLLAERAESGRC